ncbi:MAG: sulfatase-like hydrolase/transferase [Porticoccaceae bacterium]
MSNIVTGAIGQSPIKRQLTFFYLFGFVALAAICLVTNDRLFATPNGVPVYPILLLATYPAMYLLPAILLSAIAASLAPRRRGIVAGIAIVALATVALLLASDLTLYALYGFHINAFVWNVISTRGGMASLGSDQLSVSSLAAALAVVIATAWGLWLLAGIAARRRAVKLSRLLAVFILLTLSERALYAVNHFFANGPVLELAASFPLHQAASASNLLERLGYQRKQSDTVKFATLDGSEIHYPLAPLTARRGAQPPNIIMLVVESLRADMLTPEIMPKLWRFSTGAQRFDRHYSGGNGTRQGMFSLFYGLYGNSWDHFLYKRQSPVLFSVLDQHHYQRLAITSASFTYPEFDQTIFASFKPEELIEDNQGVAWGRDVRNVDRLLASLATAPSDRPQYRFMFFESTHARYNFPDAAVIRPDYLKSVDYMKLSPGYLRDNIKPFKNRYINAAHHVDAQIGRVLDAFEAGKMARNTILVVTGDHGEAFMENGRWGHNSDFSEEQVRVPFVMSIPGQSPAVIRYATSHLDLVSTLLPLLGVDAPANQYSLGCPLLADRDRLVVVSSWNDIGVITANAKIVVPFGHTTQHTNLITSVDDKPMANRGLGEFLPTVKLALARANSFTLRTPVTSVPLR